MHLSHELLVITGTSLVIGLIRSAYFKTPQWRTSLSPSWSLTSFLAVRFHCPSSMSVRELVPAAMWGSHRSERLGVEYLSHGISGLWRKWTEEQTQGKKKKSFQSSFPAFLLMSYWGQALKKVEHNLSGYILNSINFD